MTWKRITKGVQRRFTDEELKKFAAFAATTSMRNASRKFGVSRVTIRRGMKLNGGPSRRTGNFTTAESMQLAGWAA